MDDDTCTNPQQGTFMLLLAVNLDAKFAQGGETAFDEPDSMLGSDSYTGNDVIEARVVTVVREWFLVWRNTPRFEGVRRVGPEPLVWLEKFVLVFIGSAILETR
jgi:hypothetical protein